MNLPQFFMHWKILNLQSICSFNIVKCDIAFHDGCVVDFYHLDNYQELIGNKLIQKKVVRSEGFYTHVLGRVVENVKCTLSVRNSILVDKRHGVRCHDTRQSKYQKHVPHRHVIDRLIQLRLFKLIFALIEHYFAISPGIHHHRIHMRWIFQNSSSQQKLF